MRMWDLTAILRNRVLIIALIAWFIAQTLKVVLTLCFHRRLDFTRFIGMGGMPSSHAAFVMSLAATTGRFYGFDSGLFAITAALALIVMTDAAGVRRSAGNTAAALNRIVKHLIEGGIQGITQEELKELIGHTPIEVFVGALLGIVVAAFLS